MRCQCRGANSVCSCPCRHSCLAGTLGSKSLKMLVQPSGTWKQGTLTVNPFRPVMVIKITILTWNSASSFGSNHRAGTTVLFTVSWTPAIPFPWCEVYLVSSGPLVWTPDLSGTSVTLFHLPPHLTKGMKTVPPLSRGSSSELQFPGPPPASEPVPGRSPA